MSYTPDILIQKESFLKAFAKVFNGLLPDDYNIENEAKEKARKSVIRRKEFCELSKLKKQRQQLKKASSKSLDNIQEISEVEFDLILENRLKDNVMYQHICKRIKRMEHSIKDAIEYHCHYIIWKELAGLYKRDSTVKIEGKKYYWVITDLSVVAHALCDWLEENEVVHVPSYSRYDLK